MEKIERQIWKPGNMLYPLPAVMVSCQREGEKPNIITVAWAGTVCTNPAMLSISIRPERYSYGIIKESGSFVINLVPEELTFAMDFCGVKSGREIDKFKEMKLTAVPAEKVNAPMIKESPVGIECKVEQILELGSHHMFLAKVLAVQVKKSCLDEKERLLLNETGLVAYSHGAYFKLGKKIGTFGYSVARPGKREKTGNKTGKLRRNSKKKRR